MADLGAVGDNGLTADAGLFSRLAWAQYVALVTMRWRMFVFGLRSIRGILELGASGIELMIFTFVGLGLGIGLGFASYAVASHALWSYLPNRVLGAVPGLADDSGGASLISGSV